MLRNLIPPEFTKLIMNATKQEIGEREEEEEEEEERVPET